MRELDVCLVIHSCLQVHHILADDCLHLHRVEVFLIIEHITHGLLIVFYLLKFDIKHAVQLIKVLFHVVNGYSARQLEENSVKPSIKFAFQFTDFPIILLVRLSVFLEPELRVSDRLLHAHF